MSGGVEGFGSTTCWGFSPALDLAAVAPTPECSNILVVGSGDLRHVLMTLANSTKPLHFYVAESSLELLARHMLFLTLASEPLDQLGLQERSELFLELYGNTLVRHQTSQWLSEKANQLIRMVTDLDFQKETLPMLDLSLLKFKERDMLEGIFKFWRLQDAATFDISKHWEGRLRHHLGARYDSRSGVFDWDYHMKLHEMAEIVSSREYQGWRESGVAFQLRDDAPYQYTNRTLASGLITMKGGERVAKRSYWGDIVNSPYLALGLESDNKDLFHKANTKGSVDVSVWNTQWLLGRLSGVDTSRATVGEKLPSIQEVDDDDDDGGDCEQQTRVLG
jgi:dynein assembly factor 3